MSVLLNQNRDPVSRARALEAKALAAREENRRKFPTAARLMEEFRMFSPVVVEARDGENYVINTKIIKSNEVKVIPFTWMEECIRQQ